MPSGYITFPGIPDGNIKSLSAFRSVGLEPDVATLFCRPDPLNPSNPDTGGVATLSFGFNGTTINWTNCLCDRGTLELTRAGQYEVFRILDRRWYWSKAYVTQAYNLRYPDGSIDTTTQKTLAQIVTELFTLIGETVDVTAVTSTEKPELFLDHQRCVDVLEELLSTRGYVVALATDNTIKVWPKGQGTPIAGAFDFDIFTLSCTFDPPEIPFDITAVGTQTLVQSMLKCRPIGLERDGSLKPCESLSYKPAGGWAGVDMETFNVITNPIDKECAKLSVGKMYQITSQADGTQNLNASGVNYCPGEITVSSGWQYLPIYPELLNIYTDQFNKKRRDKPFVLGTFRNMQQQQNANAPRLPQNTTPFTRVDRMSWSLDRENGIVTFNGLALKFNPRVTDFADVYVLCVYSVRPLTTFVWDRYERSLNLGGIGEVQQEIDELSRQLIATYAAGSGTISTLTDNKTAVDALADQYLNAAALSYFTTGGNYVGYRGNYPFSTDGSTLQIRWDCAVPHQPVPWGTLVSQYTESIPQLPTILQRRDRRRIQMQPDPIARRNRNFHRHQKGHR